MRGRPFTLRGGISFRTTSEERSSGGPRPRQDRSRGTLTAAHLLPPFDEYTVAYKDRTAVLDPKHATYARSAGLLSPTIVLGRTGRGHVDALETT